MVSIVVSSLLPMPPGHREVARRIVRHGLADVLEWLGEPVGPEPDAQTHALRAGPGASGVIFVSQQLRDELAKLPRGKTISWDLPGGDL